MDEMEIELVANESINMAFNICREQGILLTEQASRFLRVAAEALIKDPPRAKFSTTEYDPGSSSWLRIGSAFFSEALKDERIGNEMRLRERVSFPTLMRVLSDTGYRFLLNMGFKD